MKNKIFNWFQADYFRVVFVLISVAMAFALPIISIDSGMSGDEQFHFQQAENVVNYYKTFGKDTAAVAGTGGVEGIMKYGQLPDNISFFIADTFNFADIITVRHFVNSIFGWVGILFAGLLAFRISKSWMAAIFTSLLFFFSPHFLGHSFNNLKDVPFASMMMMGVYYITRFYQTFPKPSKKICIMLAFSIGLALAIRVGGLLLIAFFGIFGLVYFVVKWMEIKKLTKEKQKKTSEKQVKIAVIFFRLFIYGIAVSIVGYFLGVALWPYALVSPIKNVMSTFATMSQFGAALRQLFEGSLQWSDLLPWYYTPKYILITSPIAVIAGLILFFTLIWKDKKNYFYYFILFFAFFFPVFWIVYTNANVYGGWRHVLFSYPPMVVAAGLGFNLILDWIAGKVKINNEFFKKIIISTGGIVVLLLLLWNPIRHIIKNHPYQYVYFNELAGGINKAYGNYEMDYYYHSTREAAEWILKNVPPNPTGEPKIKVVSWHSSSVQYFLRNDTANYQVAFARWYERGNSDWDYGIFTITGMMPEEIKNENFPPKNTVYQVTVDNKPICLVLKRETKDDYLGFKLKNNKEYTQAIEYLKKTVESDELNISIYQNLIETYLNIGMLDSAKIFIEKALEFAPKYETVNYMLAYYYNMKQNPDSALQVLKMIWEHNPKFKAAYSLAFQIYMQKKDLKSAEKTITKLMETDQMDDQSFNQLISLYKTQGLDERSAYKKAYKKYAKALEKAGKIEKAKLYRDALKKMK